MNYRKKRIAGDDCIFPVPVKPIATDEIEAGPQTPSQSKVECLAKELAEKFGKKHGLTRREFLLSSSGMAVVFMAMNAIYGSAFRVDAAEAADPAWAQEKSNQFKDQFIFDVQTHFVSPSYDSKSILSLRKEAQKWNPQIAGEKEDLNKIKFDNYYSELFEQSDTKLALLTSAPNDDPKKWFINNIEMDTARKKINEKAGKKILLCHSLITPGHPGWQDELDRAITEIKPDSWKAYTTGAPFEMSKYPWRLDDEKLMYPAYEKMLKSGITNICIHKGLLPKLYEVTMLNNWEYDKIDDVAKAAKDWPNLNFIIYHSALKSGSEPTKSEVEEFEDKGYIAWVSDLAELPKKHGLRNVYAELGSSFAVTCISNPRYCAGMLGTLIQGMGDDHVLWGTDSIFYGSPQWQIEAFRRIEIPEDIQKKFGFAPIGDAQSPTKKKIFGENARKLYGI